MKKTLMTLAAVLCCSVLFTACNKDNGGQTPEEDTKPAYAIMDYALTVGDDMLSALNLTIEYYDADGKVKTEQMTQKSWTKKVKAKLPVTLGIRLKAQLKEGVDVSTWEKFTASYGYNYNGYAVSASDLVVGNIVAHGTESTLAMKGDKVSEWLERHADGLVKFAFDFAEGGQATSRSW